MQQHFEPYVMNGGTCIGVAGKDFCVIGGDNRMSYGYSIASRNVGKIHELTSQCVIASAGMQAERKTLHKVLDSRLTWYERMHNKKMSCPAVAQLLSNTLYFKRFFPYYAFNILGGLDCEGKGCIFGYDAVGSFERLPFCVEGSGQAIITSVLDNQVSFLTQPQNKRDLSLEETIALVKDCFTVCGERDIYTGDSVTLAIITKDGIKYENFELKKD